MAGHIDRLVEEWTYFFLFIYLLKQSDYSVMQDQTVIDTECYKTPGQAAP